MDDRREQVAMAIWAANEGTRWVKNWYDLEPGVAERYYVMADAAIAALGGSREVAVQTTLPKRSRGSRLPEGFVPREETVARMSEELSATREGLIMEHRKFCDYWLAVPGQRGVKLDWDRTWCNWMRTAAERGGFGALSQGRRTNDNKVQGWADLEVSGAATTE